MTRKGFTAAVVTMLCLAVLFAIAGAFRSGANPRSIAGFAAAGAILGAIAVPELLERGTFRYPALWQMFFAILGFVVLAAVWGAPAEGYVAAVVGGALVGYIAPVWVKHIQLP